LLGDRVNNNKIEKGEIKPSLPAIKRFYKKYYSLIKEGKDIRIKFITLD